MQIQLKQAELIQAIRGFVVAQGINLTNKAVAVDFTAGRGSSGVSATISIDDLDGLPELDGDAETSADAAAAPALTLVGDTGAVAEKEAEQAPVAASSAEDTAVPEAKSLFGN